MKKLNLTIISVLGLGATTIIGCNNSSSNIILTNEQTLTMQAATSMKLLSANNVTSKTALRKNSLTEQQKQNIIEILPQIDMLLDNNIGFSSSLIEENNIIEDITYTHKETITFLDNNNKENTYTLIYKIDSSKTEFDDNRNNNEVETKENISGFAKFEDSEELFKFVSYTEFEKEDNEVEEERTFKIYTEEDSYIQVKQENEVEGLSKSTEFAYTFVEQGKKVLEYSIEIENKKNKDSIEYELNDEEYEVIRYVNTNNETCYKVKYENDDNRNDKEYAGLFKKTISEDGTTSYIFVE